jgi:hypothetical protein
MGFIADDASSLTMIGGVFVRSGIVGWVGNGVDGRVGWEGFR